MANESAIEIASKVNEIGFPEFTSKLVKDTFDTLVASQIDQVEAYAELVKETSKAISAYINDTVDSIGGEQIFAFIQNVLPDLPPSSIPNGTALTGEQASKLDNVVTITQDNGSGSEIQPAGTITTTTSKDDILNAVAKRIAANKYEIMVQIIETGLIRLVVTDGVIESKINFNTYEYQNARTSSSSYTRSSFGASLRFGGSIGRAFGIRASAGYSRLKVSTSSLSTSQGSGTNINIQGLVRINFKSDYKALTEA